MTRPRTIHYFLRFSRELSEFDYPEPGSAAVAELLSTQDVIEDDTQWVLDHGPWSVLAQIDPAADIRVVQLSLNSKFSAVQHLQIGKGLNAVRHEGVLILCSRSVARNLRVFDRSHENGFFE